MASSSHRHSVPSFWRHQLSRVVLPTIGIGALAVAGAAALSDDAEAEVRSPSGSSLVAVSDEPTVVSRGGERPTLETEAVAAERVQGQMWVVAEAALRADAATDGAVLGAVIPGSTVAVTGVVEGDWTQVMHNDLPRWVPSDVLSAEPPPPPPPAEVPLATEACAQGSAVERGLRPDTVKVYRAVCAAFPEVSSYGGVSGSGEHAAGRALDIMVTGAAGTEIADWLRAHADELGISEIIWQQQIWTQQRGGEGWRGMESRGSATANHFDHVHVTTYGDAAS